MLTNPNELRQSCRRHAHSSHRCTHALISPVAPEIRALNSVSSFLTNISECLSRGIRKVIFCLFLFLLFSSLAKAFTYDDIHCPTTEEWKQKQTGCPCKFPWSPTRELLDKILSDHADWSQNSRNDRDNIPGRAVLCNAVISNADFRGAKLEESIFSGAHLMNAQFNDAQLNFADFSGAHLMNASFDNSRMQTSKFQNGNLDNATFDGTYMPYVDFQDASLINATFNAVESETGVDTTILWSGNFTNADMRKSQFEKAELRGSDMSRANLDGATLQGANLRATVVTGARFSSVDLSNSLYAPVSQPPENNYAGLIGLQTVTFPEGEQTGLVQLRDQLRRPGLRALEREATFAIERNIVMHELQSGSIVGKFSAVAKIVFLNGLLDGACILGGHC